MPPPQKISRQQYRCIDCGAQNNDDERCRRCGHNALVLIRGGPRAIRNGRVCYTCSHTILDDTATVCEWCNGTDINERRARPGVPPQRRVAPPLPPPWDGLNLKHGGTVLLSGGPGSGKTTTCIRARPTRYIATEEELEQIASNWYRINGPSVPCPLLIACYDWTDLEDDLIDLGKNDLVIVDSISQMAEPHDARRVIRRTIEMIRKPLARGIFICQHTKDGEALGPNELRHAVDVVGTIPDDPTGLRRVTFTKNRGGALTGRYFTLEEGGVGKQDFPYAYSVEGSAGNYHLHLFPLTGAKMADLLDLMSKAGCKAQAIASSAIACEMYPEGFASPPDVAERRRFAEAHGLTWLTPEDGRRLIRDDGRDSHDEATGADKNRVDTDF